jgi:hypothetical protein
MLRCVATSSAKSLSGLTATNSANALYVVDKRYCAGTALKLACENNARSILKIDRVFCILIIFGAAKNHAAASSEVRWKVGAMAVP